MDKLLKYILLIIVGIIVYNILFNIINTFSVGNTAWITEYSNSTDVDEDLRGETKYYYNRKARRDNIVKAHTTEPIIINGTYTIIQAQATDMFPPHIQTPQYFRDMNIAPLEEIDFPMDLELNEDVNQEYNGHTYEYFDFPEDFDIHGVSYSVGKGEVVDWAGYIHRFIQDEEPAPVAPRSFWERVLCGVSFNR